jgi:hypothetical protein
MATTARATGMENGNASRPAMRHQEDLAEWLREAFLALYRRLESALPGFAWKRTSDKCIATRCPASFPQKARADRLQVYANAPWKIEIHGEGHIRFMELLNGGTRPTGQSFIDVCRKLADLAGVGFPERELSDTEIKVQAHKREHHDLLHARIELCQTVLWETDAGQEALSYLREQRGLNDDEIRSFGLGLCGRHPQGELNEVLKAQGWSERQIADHRANWPMMEGYTTFPWNDAFGQLVTAAARWPGKQMPLMKDVPAWKWQRDDLLKKWALETPFEEPQLPKVYGLSGENTKASPLYLDRALKAGHREMVVVEGLFDALMVQARGDTRVVASGNARPTTAQVETLARHGIEQVYLCADPDKAGDDATLRGVAALAHKEIIPFVVPRLPDGMDPDEFVLALGIDAWRELVSNSRHGYHHLAEALLASHGPRDAGDDGWADDLGKKAVWQARALPENRRDLLSAYFWPPISSATGIPVDELRRRYGEVPDANKEVASKPEHDGDWDFRTISLPALLARDNRPTWLVKRLIAARQSCFIGAPMKCMKTSMAADLAVSLESGTPFMGYFDVYRKQHVAFLSGESGEYTIGETIARICKARGLDAYTLPIALQFELPQLANPAHLARLAAGIKREGIEVIFIDPLYLALLSGSDVDPRSLFGMGPLLSGVTRSCLDAGATPILIHHANRAGGRKEEALGLEDLSYAGCAEYARQWLLINRRQTFTSGQPHRLRLLVGGSCGQSGLWSVDIDDGGLEDDFTGREWRVTVQPGSIETAEKERERSQKKERERLETESKEEERFLAALDKLDQDAKGASLNDVADLASLSHAKGKATFTRLLHRNIVESVAGFTVQGGNGARNKAQGVRRVPD